MNTKNTDLKLEYSEATKFLKDADILLFRHGKWTTPGWWISSFTHSPYSHAALAHKNKETGEWECVEFREFEGGRTYPLKKYVKEEEQKIDVFRCLDTVVAPTMIINGGGQPKATYDIYEFNLETAESIIKDAKKTIGKMKIRTKYGWSLIWQMSKTYIPLVRMRLKPKMMTDAEAKDGKKFVCSTLITYVFRKNMIDPVPFLSDSYTTPGDLARSSLFCKLFGIL